MPSFIQAQQASQTPQDRNQCGDRDRAYDLKSKDIVCSKQRKHYEIPQHRSTLERIIAKIRIGAGNASTDTFRLRGTPRAIAFTKLPEVSLEQDIGGIHQTSRILIRI